jgi:hypothetical protein
MACDINTAYDEILGAFKTAWDASAGAFNEGNLPEVRYDGVGKQGPPDGEEPWARVTIRHVAGGQATLLGDAQVTRFTASGIITIQVFYPLKRGGLSNARSLAKVAKSAYEGKSTPSNVWFRNVRIVEVGPDGPWYNVNVLANFEYDELVS